MTKFRRVLIWLHADAEALQVTYDPSKITYRQLVEFLYRMHDPTTTDRQGPDTGSQYRSGIFYHDEEQKKIAEEVTKLANEKWWKGKIVTQILPAGEWWDAEDYHQVRFLNNSIGPSHQSGLLISLDSATYRLIPVDTNALATS
jgi:peptide-methionine (S)-S-oxide reductase